MHAVRAAMHSLKKTGTDFSSAKGMDPKAFFEAMGQLFNNEMTNLTTRLILCLRSQGDHRFRRECGWVCIPGNLMLATSLSEETHTWL